VPKNKVTLSAEVGEETDLYRDFQDWEDGYYSRAEAIRAAIRGGMDSDETSAQTAGTVGTVEAFVMTAGYISLFFAFFGLVVGAYATVAVALFAPAVSAGLVAGVSGLLVLTWVTVAAAVFVVRWTSVGERLGVATA